jgi:hypothetical protein
LYNNIDWNHRIIAITGAKGVGKTTLIFQYLKEKFRLDNSILYISLDDIFFSINSLTSIVEKFVQNGGKFLFLDEIHKYPGWMDELKDIYNSFPNLRLVICGLSISKILEENSKLSRAIVHYEMQGLSFREFVELESGNKFDILSLNNILENHIEISHEISDRINSDILFSKYLRYGYYPYFLNGINEYPAKLAEIINIRIESDLTYAKNIDFNNIRKIKKLLLIIANSIPLRPNISKLSENISATRGTILQYLDYLAQARFLNMLKKDHNTGSFMTKPEKIFLNNTNLIHILSANFNDRNLSETFFFNQLKSNHSLVYNEECDFLIDQRYIFNIGGKPEKIMQDLPDFYIVEKDIEIGFMNRIPLWLFGFLY